MEAAISIHNLSKKFTLSGDSSYVALRDVLANSFKNLFKQKNKETFWALKDINLDIQQGERVGIIGHNGAGKSTLLKIISRITPPTHGEIILNGRVASLLEVGTGFHPELTGRENIYLNGSILGLKKAEIDKKLDEIIDFSGVEKFIDTPLKHYSSGMQLRLAFSVAAHLEPEILLIDEVLAVGDMEFQKKCIGKMEEVSKQQGRTIVFVSHNMAAIKQLCTSAIILEKGTNIFAGEVEDAINYYSQHLLYKVKKGSNEAFDLSDHPNKVRKEEGILTAKMYVNEIATERFTPGADLKIELSYFLKTPLIDPDIGIVIKDEQYNSIIGLNNKDIGKKVTLLLNEKGTATILIPKLNIYRPGKYRVNLYFGDHYHFREHLYDAFEFTVLEKDVYESDRILNPTINQIFVPGMQIIAK